MRVTLPPHHQERACGEQYDADRLHRADRVLVEPEEPELVDDHAHRQLPGDRRGDDPACAERAHGHQHRRDVAGAEQAADQVLRRKRLRLRDLAEAAFREPGDHREDDRAGQEREERGLLVADRLAELGVDRTLEGDHPADDGGEHDCDAAVHYLASSQFGPVPDSTASGGSMSAAAIISRRTISVACSASSVGPSNSSSSWICRMVRVLRPASRSATWARTIATLMMSAAVPWITELTASRSPSLRVCQLRARISGIWRRRPNSVLT